MTLKEGTYEYTGSYGVNIRANVQGGRVTLWERDGVPACARDYTAIDFTRCLADEVNERERLTGVLHPIRFTPADTAAPTLCTCTDSGRNAPDASCPHCKGTGTVSR